MVSAVPFFIYKTKGFILLKEYLKTQNKTNEKIIADSFTSDELNRFSKSDLRWADNRSKQFQHRTVKKGEIYQFEFGKNYAPEMSYEHRGLVIGVKKKLLYVLPIFSYNPSKHTDVYHPVNFPNSKSDLFLLKSSEFPFISHDSVLKLNDIRTISINRTLYQQAGCIPLSSDTYKEIEKFAFQKCFPSYAYEYNKFQQAYSDLEAKNKVNEEAKEKLMAENESLQRQVAELKEKISELRTQ